MNDPHVRFNHQRKAVEVDYDETTLNDIYPFLVYYLKERAKKELGDTTAAKPLEQLGSGTPRTAGYWARQRERVDALGRAAVEAANQVTAEPADYQTVRTREELGDLVEAEQGFAIGENHKEYRVWRFLVDNLEYAKGRGLATLYLEPIRRDGYQDVVDEYLASAAGAEMPPTLATFCGRYRANVNHDGLRELLVEAKRLGIRVQGVDAYPARRQPYQGPSASMREWRQHHKRAAMMNVYAKHIVETDQETNPGKYAMVLGDAHVDRHRFTGDRAELTDEPEYLLDLPDEVPGTAQYLGIPAVRIAEPEAAAED
ncbi:hypothetical protein [Amycolatopsis anabasis]|uniref:hypothetical protein n=1 Tax=Amycolatopsis anabasis TaxID=1840409 RepID=UPI00131BDAA5|nr:hypothetical protein [Amycolatopsis anabasis]